ncbi:nucleotidyltransferase family protein [Actinomyces radicidentis]|uniref:Toxin-antitoxin system toxin subunit n=1 Tax=Actinomyces radicidentis TaxID=111015 RepID=A0A0X8JD86_ACTRD|nr:nucleotidyltransferase domain-containing protein [Actinomyces radicidentis]AMD86444.1 toxin-antitoxin system toxin subunit [Actinomyces radicidentis]
MTAVSVELDEAAVAAACRRHGVERLRLFGSAATGGFDPRTSDVDLLVDFAADRPNRFEDFFGLREELEALAQRPVDLVTADALRNPYFRSSVLSTAVDLYAD